MKKENRASLSRKQFLRVGLGAIGATLVPLACSSDDGGGNPDGGSGGSRGSTGTGGSGAPGTGGSGGGATGTGGATGGATGTGGAPGIGPTR
jgi:hypothetical protein